MKRLRIYVDTSVIGGCFDPEFDLWSNGLLQDFRSGVFSPVLSEVTSAEVAHAPTQVREVHAELISIGEVVPISREALEILAAYEVRSILGARYRADMLHVALATAALVDVLVSWNFRHIVRLDKMHLFNAVNLELGYKPLEIYSPREVTTYERED